MGPYLHNRQASSESLGSEGNSSYSHHSRASSQSEEEFTQFNHHRVDDYFLRPPPAYPMRYYECEGMIYTEEEIVNLEETQPSPRRYYKRECYVCDPPPAYTPNWIRSEIHGNEKTGTPLMDRLLRYAQQSGWHGKGGNDACNNYTIPFTRSKTVGKNKNNVIPTSSVTPKYAKPLVSVAQRIRDLEYLQEKANAGGSFKKSHSKIDLESKIKEESTLCPPERPPKRPHLTQHSEGPPPLLPRAGACLAVARVAVVIPSDEDDVDDEEVSSINASGCVLGCSSPRFGRCLSPELPLPPSPGRSEDEIVVDAPLPLPPTPYRAEKFSNSLKTTDDYLEGLFDLNVTFGHSAHGVRNSSESTLDCKTRISKRSAKSRLDTLKAERSAVEEDTRLNQNLGRSVFERVKNVANSNEYEKFTQHVDEVDKITRLLVGLSSRLARAENTLRNLAAGCSKERNQICAKRDKLTEQLEEAKRLKENIDRRRLYVTSFLRNYLSPEEYADFDHFIKMQSKVLIDLRRIDDEITLCEEEMLTMN